MGQRATHQAVPSVQHHLVPLRLLFVEVIVDQALKTAGMVPSLRSSSNVDCSSLRSLRNARTGCAASNSPRGCGTGGVEERLPVGGGGRPADRRCPGPVRRNGGGGAGHAQIDLLPLAPLIGGERGEERFSKLSSACTQGAECRAKTWFVQRSWRRSTLYHTTASASDSNSGSAADLSRIS